MFSAIAITFVDGLSVLAQFLINILLSIVVCDKGIIMIIVKKWTNPNTAKSINTVQVISGNTLYGNYENVDCNCVKQLLTMYSNHSLVMYINVAQKADLQ